MNIEEILTELDNILDKEIKEVKEKKYAVTRHRDMPLSHWAVFMSKLDRVEIENEAQRWVVEYIREKLSE